MTSIMKSVFGVSWATTLLGYLVAILLELKVVLEHDGTPVTMNDWITMILGVCAAVFGRMTKQVNVTNAAHPTPSRPVAEVQVHTPTGPIVTMEEKKPALPGILP